MKLPTKFIEAILMFFMASPFLGALYIAAFDVKAVVFWLFYIAVLLAFKNKLFNALKVGSFPYYFIFLFIVFSGMGWFFHHVNSNGFNNSGGVTFFFLPVLLVVIIYTKNSASYKQAIDVFNKS